MLLISQKNTKDEKNRSQFCKKKYESKKGNALDESSNEIGKDKKLYINEDLKVALLTHSYLSAIQIDGLLDDVYSQSDV